MVGSWWIVAFLCGVGQKLMAFLWLEIVLADAVSN